jgi:hypothetical protein
MNPRVFLDVDPRTLRVPGSLRSEADPWKLQRQMAQFGSSTQGMPPVEVSRGADGELVINNGVTRATRIAKLAPGTLIRVEVIGGAEKGTRTVILTPVKTVRVWEAPAARME